MKGIVINNIYFNCENMREIKAIECLAVQVKSFINDYNNHHLTQSYMEYYETKINGMLLIINALHITSKEVYFSDLVSYDCSAYMHWDYVKPVKFIFKR